MAQTNKFNIDANLQGAVFREQANEKLSALASLNAGEFAPVNTVGGMFWLDTSSSSKHYLKIRNADNTAWGIVCEINPLTGEAKASYSKDELDGFLETKIDKTQLSQPSGVATLDETGKLKQDQLPDNIESVFIHATLSNFPQTGQTGKLYLAENTGKLYRYNGVNYVKVGGGVDSVNSLVGEVTLDKTHVGLGNVDNTSDLSKPISTATQQALNNINAKFGTTPATRWNVSRRIFVSLKGLDQNYSAYMDGSRDVELTPSCISCSTNCRTSCSSSCSGTSSGYRSIDCGCRGH